MTKSRLKAEMLGVFREIEQTGRELVVTDRGKPVLKVIPLVPRKAGVDKIFKNFRGKVVYRGNVLKSTQSEWKKV